MNKNDSCFLYKADDGDAVVSLEYLNTKTNFEFKKVIPQMYFES